MRYTAKPVEVEAFQITEVGHLIEEGLALAIDRPVDSIVIASREMISRITPKVGDYWVIQADGYTYLNPKDVFERKYQPAEMNALELGAAVRHAGLSGS